MSQITIPGLPNNPAPPDTVLFEISNAGVSENITLAAIIIGLQNISEKNQPNGYAGLDGAAKVEAGQIPELPQSRITNLETDLAARELIANKGIASGYAGLDAGALLQLANYPAGNGLEFLRRNAANDALEFAVLTPIPQSPITQDIDYAGFSTFNLLTTTYNLGAEPAAPAAGNIVQWAESLFGIPLLRYKDENDNINSISENLYSQIRNNSGAPIASGSAIYITGSSGNNPTIDLADASDNAKMPAIGITLGVINNNSNGLILIQGVTKGFDTSTFAPGDLLYVSDTVPGGIDNTPSIHPNLNQAMGLAVDSAANGTVAIFPQEPSGSEQGTNQNIYKIGDGQAGPKQLDFTNDFTQTLLFNPTANRTNTMPDAAGVFVLDTFAQSLTNKSIALGSNTLTGTFAELNAAITDATLVDLSSGQTLLNKVIDGALNTISNIGASEIIPDIIAGQTLKGVPIAADEILITDSADSGNLKRTTLTALLAMSSQTPIAQPVDYASFPITNLGTLNTHTIPGGTDTFAMLAAVQTLTSKTIDLASNTVTMTFNELNTAVSDATIVDLNQAQILTNKTIDAALNTLSGISGLTGLGVQVQSLNMANNNIIFGLATGGQIATTTTEKIAFYGATPIVQPVDGATLTNNVTSGGTDDQIDNFTDLSVYANDAATIRNDIYQLARKLKIITDNMRALGLES